jgi:chromosome segregation ATPase
MTTSINDVATAARNCAHQFRALVALADALDQLAPIANLESELATRVAQLEAAAKQRESDLNGINALVEQRLAMKRQFDAELASQRADAQRALDELISSKQVELKSIEARIAAASGEYEALKSAVAELKKSVARI